MHTIYIILKINGIATRPLFTCKKKKKIIKKWSFTIPLDSRFVSWHDGIVWGKARYEQFCFPRATTAPRQCTPAPHQSLPTPFGGYNKYVFYLLIRRVIPLGDLNKSKLPTDTSYSVYYIVAKLLYHSTCQLRYPRGEVRHIINIIISSSNLFLFFLRTTTDSIKFSTFYNIYYV